MRNPSQLLISILLSVQIASAIPVPVEELAPLGNTLKTAASALQTTTKGLSTGMAGGLGGMAGASPAPIPTIQKRQITESLALNLAGVEPGDVMKTIEDPTTALKKLPIPIESLTKRVLGALGGLGGLGGLLGGLPGLGQKDNPPPSAAAFPPPSTPPSSEGAKDRGTDSSINESENEGEDTDDTSLSELEGALDDAPPSEAPPSAQRNAADISPGPLNSTTITTHTIPESTAENAGQDPTLSTNNAQTEASIQSELQPEAETQPGPESEPENIPESITASTPNINTVTNSQEGEPAAQGTETEQTPTEPTVFKRFLKGLKMPSGKVSGEGWRDPKVVLEESGATDIVKTIIDAPGITGLRKEKRTALIDPLGKLDSVSKTLDSAGAVLKAVPLAQTATA